ncbi:MAG: glycine cleavage system protein GcvH [Planctomycetes bacterium]|nr:glycine cleavage system protein GcvH [Planctomycetota bacterium]
MLIPENLLYTEEHEWLRLLDDDIAIVGITDYAQQQLGDLVFIELPKNGDRVVAGDEFGSLESVKASSELYSPVSGQILAVNESLAENPEIVNNSPYDEGWMFKIKLEDLSETHGLMNDEAYEFHLKRNSSEEEESILDIDEDEHHED